MPIQAFVDDSGSKGSTDNFVLAGLVAPAENWWAFSDEWRAFLSQTPALRSFKMKEAVGLGGQFYGWTEEQRDAKLRGLARIINRYVYWVIYSGVELTAHGKTWGKLPKPFNDPYFHPFQCVIMATCFTLWDAGWRERVEIVFDENVIFGPRARTWYPVMRQLVHNKGEDAHAIMPVDPLFRTDDEFLPLQAADLWAWCMMTPDMNPRP